MSNISKKYLYIIILAISLLPTMSVTLIDTIKHAPELLKRKQKFPEVIEHLKMLTNNLERYINRLQAYKEKQITSNQPFVYENVLKNFKHRFEDIEQLWQTKNLHNWDLLKQIDSKLLIRPIVQHDPDLWQILGYKLTTPVYVLDKRPKSAPMGLPAFGSEYYDRPYGDYWDMQYAYNPSFEQISKYVAYLKRLTACFPAYITKLESSSEYQNMTFNYRYHGGKTNILQEMKKTWEEIQQKWRKYYESDSAEKVGILISIEPLAKLNKFRFDNPPEIIRIFTDICDIPVVQFPLYGIGNN